MLPATPGTYALLLRCDRAGCIRVGRAGDMQVRRGYYVYVGSVCGPGGLRARIRHHQSPTVRPHWHIDYLRQQCSVVGVWHCGQRCEHEWAANIAALPGARIPLAGFGSSDCGCRAHLAYFSTLRAMTWRPGA